MKIYKFSLRLLFVVGLVVVAAHWQLNYKGKGYQQGPRMGSTAVSQLGRGTPAQSTMPAPMPATHKIEPMAPAEPFRPPAWAMIYYN